MSGFENDILYAKNGDFSQADNQAVSENNGLVTNGKMWIGSTALNAGGTHINVGSITSPTGTLTIGYNSPNITMDVTRDLHWPKFIVGDTSNGANYATIAEALAAASTGDSIAIQPGTYTENLTLKNGINICGLNPRGGSGSRTLIVGKMIDGGGNVNCTINNVALRTNSDFFLATTGSGTIILESCYLDCTNNTGISCGGTSIVTINNALGGLQTTGIGLYTNSATINIYNSTLTNAGASTTATNTSGGATIRDSNLVFPLSTSSAGTLQIFNSTIDGSPTNTTAVTLAGTGTSSIYESQFRGGTATAISVGSGTTCRSFACNVNSSNVNAIDGAGTYSDALTIFSGTSSKNNVTTLSFPVVGTTLTWTPDLKFGGANTGITYSARSGTYTRIGNVVTFTCSMVLTSKGSATGAATITGLPYASAATSIFAISASLLTFTGMVNARLPASSTFSIDQWATGGARAQLDDTAFANTTIIQISGTYLA